MDVLGGVPNLIGGKVVWTCVDDSITNEDKNNKEIGKCRLDHEVL